jgi:hypothetical protein
MKEIRLLSLLFIVALFVQNADATLTYLPYSSHYQGRSYFNYSDTGVRGWVEFAVYDTLGSYGNEWTAATGFAAPGDGQYIYAYQIFNYISSVAIGRFTMWADDYHEITAGDMSEQDPQEGDYPIFGLDFVEPTASGTNDSGEQIWWEFEDGLLVAGKDSWFLIFSNPSDWVPGNYKMEPVSGEIPLPPNPEPCTLALLGLGSTILFAKRRSSTKPCGVCSHS